MGKSQIVTVQDYLMHRDPDKYKAMFVEKERIAGQTIEVQIEQYKDMIKQYEKQIQQDAEILQERDEKVRELEVTIGELVIENEAQDEGTKELQAEIKKKGK